VRLGGPYSESERYREVVILESRGLKLRPLGLKPVASRYFSCATATPDYNFIRKIRIKIKIINNKIIKKIIKIRKIGPLVNT
jgi:hypothetical protein